MFLGGMNFNKILQKYIDGFVNLYQDFKRKSWCDILVLDKIWYIDPIGNMMIKNFNDRQAYNTTNVQNWIYSKKIVL